MLLIAATQLSAQTDRQAERTNPTEMYTRMADRLARQMKLDDDKAASFKLLYLDYQTARHNATNPAGENQSDGRLDLDKLTDEEAAELIQKRFQAQEAGLAVDKKYYTEFLQILTPRQAVQVYLGGRGMGRGDGQGDGRRQGGTRSGRFSRP